MMTSRPRAFSKTILTKPNGASDSCSRPIRCAATTAYDGDPMNRAYLVIRKLAVKPENVVDTSTLDHQDRHRRRMAMKADGGLEFLLDLGNAAVLEDCDALKLEDGKLVRVAAKPEDLIEITTDNPLRLM